MISPFLELIGLRSGRVEINTFNLVRASNIDIDAYHPGSDPNHFPSPYHEKLPPSGIALKTICKQIEISARQLDITRKPASNFPEERHLRVTISRPAGRPSSPLNVDVNKLIIARHIEKRKGQGKEIIGNERGKGMGSASDDAFRDLQSQRSNNPTIKVVG